MPIFNHPTKGRVLFIHIPKTGGSSIERWIQNAGYELEKINHWAGDKHQHATREVYETWGEFDYKFTVVRHPLSRFISALGFKLIASGDADRITRDIITHYYRRKSLIPHWVTHITPQVDYLSDDVEIFRFEDDFFSQLNDVLELPGPYPHENKSRSTVSASDLSPHALSLVTTLYREDYNVLGYKP